MVHLRQTAGIQNRFVAVAATCFFVLVHGVVHGEQVEHPMLNSEELEDQFWFYTMEPEPEGQFKVCVITDGWIYWSTGFSYENALSEARQWCKACPVFAVGNTIVWDMSDAEKDEVIAEYTTEITASAIAQYELGNRAPSVDEAAKWYRKAAEQGHAGAQAALAYMYQNGNGLPLDFKEAEKWYRRAVEQGHQVALLQLAMMYFERYQETGEKPPDWFIQMMPSVDIITP